MIIIMIIGEITSIVHNLNLCVTAEGPKIQEQLSFLVENACNSVQGYMFSQMINLNHFSKRLNKQR